MSGMQILEFQVSSHTGGVHNQATLIRPLYMEQFREIGAVTSHGLVNCFFIGNVRGNGDLASAEWIVTGISMG